MKNGGKTFNASDVANADWNILPGLTRRRTRAQRARGPIGGGGVGGEPCIGDIRRRLRRGSGRSVKSGEMMHWR